VSMQDPIADMLTRIRNGQLAKHEYVTMGSSKLKVEIVKVLEQEGYIEDHHVEKLENNSTQISIKLKYYQGEPVIERIKKISKPGLRVYSSSKDLQPVPGFGIYILSTSRGVMSHQEAKKMGVGGEVLCEVA